MASEKISALAALGAAPDTSDLLVMVDVSDLTMALSGTTKNMTVGNVASALGGTFWALNGNTVGTIKTLGTIDEKYFPIITNNIERARIDTLGNFGIGLAAGTVNRFQVKGSGSTSATYTSIFQNSANAQSLVIRDDGYVGVGIDPSYPFELKNTAFKQLGLYRNGNNGDGPCIVFSSNVDAGVKREGVRIFGLTTESPASTYNSKFCVETEIAGTFQASLIYSNQTTTANGGGLRIQNIGMSTIASPNAVLDVRSSFTDANNLALFYNNSTDLVHWMQNNGNIYWNYNNTGKSVVGAYIASPSAQFTIQGAGATSATFGMKVQNSSGTINFTVRDDGLISMLGLQTGNAGLSAGDLYKDTAANILANGDYIVARKA